MYNNKRHAWFFNILKNQPTRAAWKNFLSIFTNILKSICTWIHTSNSQWGFASTLLAIKRCIQNIANNLREDDFKKSSCGYFFDKKFMFENISTFDFRKYQYLWKQG